MNTVWKEYDYWACKGMRKPKEKLVCAVHLDDYALKAFIEKEGEQGTCSYCMNSDDPVVSLEQLVEQINSCLNYFYDDAENGVSYASEEGGYYGVRIFEIEELIDDTLPFDPDEEELRQDILAAFDPTKAWSEQDPYGDREDDALNYSWRYFKNIVKYQCRYFFGKTSSFHGGTNGNDVFEILNDIGRIVDKLEMFTEMPAGAQYFRCRHHDSTITITSVKDLVSPPLKYTTASNRMSPAGISMFYCAFDAATAKSETVPFAITGSTCTTARFIANSSFNLLDLSKLPPVPSVFDEQKRDDYFSIRFLKDFIKDFTGEVTRDGREHIEYVPTQIVTEYFKHVYEELSHILVEGIIYPSSKDPDHNSCVLFLDHEASLKVMHLEEIF